jgi:hypothetical protein
MIPWGEFLKLGFHRLTPIVVVKEGVCHWLPLFIAK